MKLTRNNTAFIKNLIISALCFGGTAALDAAAVNNTDNAGPGSLRHAITNAASGEAITFAVNSTITLADSPISSWTVRSLLQCLTVHKFPIASTSGLR